MATLPRATTRLDPNATAPGGGLNLVCVLAAVAILADMQPRLFGSADAISDLHGYSEGVEYSALHTVGTKKPILFVPMPIGTPGALSRSTGFGNSGSSVVSVVAGADGCLTEHDGVLRCLVGGTIGTSQVKLELSLDGGRSFRAIRLGTANSYVLPLINVTANFAAGTLVAGDTILEWHGSGPKIDVADLIAVRANLAADSRFFRSGIVIGDLPDATAALAVVTQANAYATENDRNVYFRASVPDRLPQALLAHSYGRMTGDPTLTFAEVGASGDTITRNTGSWIADGFVVGDTIVITGAVASAGINNITAVIASLSATVITLGTDDVVAEVIAGCTVTGSPTLTFAASGDTIVRNRGSWLADGFRVADSVTIDGTASNDVTLAAVTVTALTLTLANGLANETIRSSVVTVTAGETKAQWMARQDNEFEDIDGMPRIDLSAGRGAPVSPYSGWSYRRPAAWAASVREYQHDLHVPTWRKDVGPLGYDLFDANNELVEWDDRADGGAGCAARFTTLRTWSNGPRGSFVALSLTRAGDGQTTSLTHNFAVVNAGLNTVQLATENVIGRTLLLNADGTATKDSLAVIAGEVNAQLERELMTDRGEGPRSSFASWAPNPADDYSVPEPLMTGTLNIMLNGTIHSVATVTRVNSVSAAA